MQEVIALTDTAVSLIESVPADTKTLTVVPGSVFTDAAAGSVLITSVSALFQISDAAQLNGSTPRVGVDIPLATVAAKNNLPGVGIV